jgi:hypothetical protein
LRTCSAGTKQAEKQNDARQLGTHSDWPRKSTAQSRLSPLRKYLLATVRISSYRDCGLSNLSPANPFSRRRAIVSVWVALDRRGTRVNIFPEQNVGS